MSTHLRCQCSMAIYLTFSLYTFKFYRHLTTWIHHISNHVIHTYTRHFNGTFSGKPGLADCHIDFPGIFVSCTAQLFFVLIFHNLFLLFLHVLNKTDCIVNFWSHINKTLFDMIWFENNCSYFAKLFLKVICKFLLQHIILLDNDGSPELVLEPELPAGEVSDDVRSFCDTFSLPLSERPLPGLHVFTVLSVGVIMLNLWQQEKYAIDHQ